MKGDNPCNICKSQDNCEGCVLDRLWCKRGECGNCQCFCHYECGCLLGLDSVCKASDCYIHGENDEDDEDDDI